MKPESINSSKQIRDKTNQHLNKAFKKILHTLVSDADESANCTVLF